MDAADDGGVLPYVVREGEFSIQFTWPDCGDNILLTGWLGSLRG